MSKLSNKLKDKGATMPKDRKPLWRGPYEDGVTQSLLAKFLGCRERFRLLVVEGLKQTPRFKSALEYGNFWHTCEEAFNETGSLEKTMIALQEYAKEKMKEFPTEQSEVEKWYQVCMVQFGIYLKHFKNCTSELTPIMQEQVFHVPYELSTGHKVTLCGKFDSVHFNKYRKLVLWENKTKREVYEPEITSRLSFDLQTMFYLVALEQYVKQHKRAFLEHKLKSLKPNSILYNVVRRPLSGGKGTIKPHKPTKKNPRGETPKEYYARLKQVLTENRHEYFLRLEVEVSDKELQDFKVQFMDPILTQLCDWWHCVVMNRGQAPWGPLHFRYPYGVYNPTLEGVASDVDEYLSTGSMLGLTRVKTLFPELE